MTKPRLISKPEVLDRVGVAYVTLWGWMQQGKFPRSRSVGRETVWVEQEIEEWILTRPLSRIKGLDNDNTKQKQKTKQRA